MGAPVTREVLQTSCRTFHLVRGWRGLQCCDDSLSEPKVGWGRCGTRREKGVRPRCVRVCSTGCSGVFQKADGPCCRSDPGGEAVLREEMAVNPRGGLSASCTSAAVRLSDDTRCTTQELPALGGPWHSNPIRRGRQPPDGGIPDHHEVAFVRDGGRGSERVLKRAAGHGCAGSRGVLPA